MKSIRPTRLIQPMLATLANTVPCSDYAFEIKWDGVRAITYIQNKKILIRSRNDLDITHRYPELQALASTKGIKNAVLDGEIVAFDSKGAPSFQRLQKRMLLKHEKDILRLLNDVPVRYMIFDLLELNGKSLLNQPYEERRKILTRLKLRSEAWEVPENLSGNYREILDATARIGLEGIIAKRRESLYLPGLRSRDWLKLKNTHSQELIIAGYQKGEGSRSDTFGSLLLGYYDLTREQARKQKRPQKLFYAGECGTGFNQKTLADLLNRLKALRIETSIFENPPHGHRLVFTKPTLVGEFHFTEWTQNNTLRHPSFKGLRLDKNPKDITREIPR